MKIHRNLTIILLANIVVLTTMFLVLRYNKTVHLEDKPQSSLAMEELTANWIIDHISGSKESIKFFGVELGMNVCSNINLSKPSKVILSNSGSHIGIDQENIHPLSISFDDNEIVCHISDGNHFLYGEIFDGGLPFEVRPPKLDVITGRGLFIIGSRLYTKLCNLSGSRPLHMLVEDEEGNPKDHYIWSFGDRYVDITAQRSDVVGSITIRLTKDSPKKKLSDTKPSTQLVFPGWNNLDSPGWQNHDI